MNLEKREKIREFVLETVKRAKRGIWISQLAEKVHRTFKIPEKFACDELDFLYYTSSDIVIAATLGGGGAKIYPSMDDYLRDQLSSPCMRDFPLPLVKPELSTSNVKKLMALYARKAQKQGFKPR